MRKIIVSTIVILLSIVSVCFADAGVVVYADYNRQLLVMQTDQANDYYITATIDEFMVDEQEAFRWISSH